MSILSGQAIVAARERGDIVIDPFRPEMVNPASVDLTLGDHMAVYINSVGPPTALVQRPLDPRVEQPVMALTIPSTGFTLRPGIGYLMHTVERVGSRRYVPVLDGKSSMGRLFVQIHVTAGFGDPGFFGQWTLEVVVTHPVILYPGMRIAQMRFHEMSGDVKLYEGNYKDDAEGPVASRAWRQFEK
jgi:dCTP deaminase